MIDNRTIVKRAFSEFYQEMNNRIYDELDKFCQNLLLEAVIANRRGAPGAHQFTGNLINSIVVIMFDKDGGIQTNYFAYDRLKNPIRREMSSRTTRGTVRKNAVHFSPDWQNTPESIYKPEVVTDRSLGPDDAKSFASSWTPTTGAPFEICVAYTSEYAGWVEEHRKTTGFVNSMRYSRKALLSYGLKRI